VPIPDPEVAAEIVVQRLIDAGFEVRPAERCHMKRRRRSHRKRNRQRIARHARR